MMQRPRALILAESCNPEWPSLPIVAYKYVRSLAKKTEITVVTHVRNRENIEKAGEIGAAILYSDNEWLAGPMYKLSVALRRGPEFAWSIQQMMDYLPYLEFERRALKMCRPALEAGKFDIIHRITPITPTLPSYIAGRTRQPFVIGPLNGNLPWPDVFRAEKRREKEWLRGLRVFSHYMPFAKRTYTQAAAVLASFRHTVSDLVHVDPKRVVPMPEVGFDGDLFHAKGRRPPFSGEGPFQFLYAGRLVPVKLLEAAIRAFGASPAMRQHHFTIVGDGPERARLESIVAETDSKKNITFLGRKTQQQVAQLMREADAFVFPSIRELGAGVVIEAMASGAVVLVSDYGAPGNLAARGRGVVVPIASLDKMTEGFRAALERCLTDPDEMRTCAEAGRAYATALYEWDTKADYTLKIYQAVIEGRSLEEFTDYV